MKQNKYKFIGCGGCGGSGGGGASEWSGTNDW